MDVNRTIGIQISKLRELHEDTQDDLAAAIGVSRITVANWETGKRNASTDNILKIANYYQCPIDYLFNVSDVTTRDGKIKSACDYIGLSDSAADSLRRIMRWNGKNPKGYYHENRKIINEFISGKGYHFFNQLCLQLSKINKLKAEIEKIKEMPLEEQQAKDQETIALYKELRLTRLELIEAAQALSEPEYTNVKELFEDVLQGGY